MFAFRDSKAQNSGCYVTENNYIARRGFQKQNCSAADVSLVFLKCFVCVTKVYSGVISELPVLNRKRLQTALTAIAKKSTLPPERTVKI